MYALGSVILYLCRQHRCIYNLLTVDIMVASFFTQFYFKVHNYCSTSADNYIVYYKYLILFVATLVFPQNTVAK